MKKEGTGPLQQGPEENTTKQLVIVLNLFKRSVEAGQVV